MAKPRRKCWSFSAGRRPYTVGICEFEPGSNLFIRVWDRSRGDYRYKSLGHKNRKRAIAVAHRAAERLRRGKTDILLERVTLRRLFHTPEVRSQATERSPLHGDVQKNARPGP
jgi:hypothetical protein